jgi:hypothetical protein
MTALLCFPPDILDQSFPRDGDELVRAADAVAEIVDRFNNDEFELIAPDALTDFVSDLVEWSGNFNPALLLDIYNALAHLLLSPRGGVHVIDTSSVSIWSPHPVPEGCEGQGFVAMWAEEVGKLLALHDGLRNTTEPFCVGVACSKAFADLPIGTYSNGAPRMFPLCGPAEIDYLGDAYYWVTSSNIVRKDVSFKDAHDNLHLIGGRVHKANGTSHYRVEFSGARSWPLDRNTDPIPERFLRQLVSITGFPLEVIKQTLITGERPDRRLLFAAFVHRAAPAHALANA